MGSSQGRNRQRRGQPIVEAVLTATVEELARVGYEALSVEEVAVRAGVNKTTVYRRWPAKDELVAAALLQTARSEIGNVDTGSLRGDLRVILRRVAGVSCTPQGRCLMRFMHDTSNTEVANLARRMRESEQTPPRLAVRRAIDRGELPKSTDPVLLLTVLFGGLQHRLILEPDLVDEYEIERIIDLVLRGALAGGGAPPLRDEAVPEGEKRRRTKPAALVRTAERAGARASKR